MIDFRIIQTQTGWGRILQSFARWCEPQPGWRTLDVGCGPGLLPALFSKQGCLAYGIDQDTAAFAPTPLHPAVLQGQAACLPFTDHAFQLVTASNLLFFLADPLEVLREISRVTQPGGWVGVINPSERMSVKAAAALAEEQGLQGAGRESLINWAERAEAHNRWSRDEIRVLFAAASLELVDSSYKAGPGLALFARGRRSSQ